MESLQFGKTVNQFQLVLDGALTTIELYSKKKIDLSVIKNLHNFIESNLESSQKTINRFKEKAFTNESKYTPRLNAFIDIEGKLKAIITELKTEFIQEAINLKDLKALKSSVSSLKHPLNQDQQYDIMKTILCSKDYEFAKAGLTFLKEIGWDLNYKKNNRSLVEEVLDPSMGTNYLMNTLDYLFKFGVNPSNNCVINKESFLILKKEVIEKNLVHKHM